MTKIDPNLPKCRLAREGGSVDGTADADTGEP
jgi:hypothetical protein